MPEAASVVDTFKFNTVMRSAYEHMSEYQTYDKLFDVRSIYMLRQRFPLTPTLNGQQRQVAMDHESGIFTLVPPSPPQTTQSAGQSLMATEHAATLVANSDVGVAPFSDDEIDAMADSILEQLRREGIPLPPPEMHRTVQL